MKLYKLVKWLPVIMGSIGLIQLVLDMHDWSVVFFFFMALTYTIF
nr:MAG TPA: hypothetical protein [Herelleviridae sp.]